MILVTYSLQHCQLPAYCTISTVGLVVILVFVLSSLVRKIEPIFGAYVAMLSRTYIYGKNKRICLLNIICDLGMVEQILLFLAFFNLINITPSMCL